MSFSSELTPDPTSASSRQALILRLYIAGGALNSLLALRNIKAICEEYFPKNYNIEVIDVFENPQRALTDNVLVTPTLVKVAPLPNVRLVGNLSQKQTVLLVLQATLESP